MLTIDWTLIIFIRNVFVSALQFVVVMAGEKKIKTEILYNIVGDTYSVL